MNQELFEAANVTFVALPAETDCYIFISF